jgi:hypothetical protein
MAPPPAPDLNTVTVVSAIATLQATAAASHERIVGVVVAVDAPASTISVHPQPPASLPFFTVGASAPVGPVGPLAAIAALGHRSCHWHPRRHRR